MCTCVCMSVSGALESGAEAEETQYNVTSKSYGVIWNTEDRMTDLDCPHSRVCITPQPQLWCLYLGGGNVLFWWKFLFDSENT